MRFYWREKNFTNKSCLFYAKFVEFEVKSYSPFFWVASSLSILCFISMVSVLSKLNKTNCPLMRDENYWVPILYYFRGHSITTWRRRGEGGFSRKSTGYIICKIFMSVYSRRGGGQKWLNFDPSSCWMTPYGILLSRLPSNSVLPNWVSGWGPSLYYVSTFLDFFWSTHPTSA